MIASTLLLLCSVTAYLPERALIHDFWLSLFLVQCFFFILFVHWQQWKLLQLPLRALDLCSFMFLSQSRFIRYYLKCVFWIVFGRTMFFGIWFFFSAESAIFIFILLLSPLLWVLINFLTIFLMKIKHIFDDFIFFWNCSFDGASYQYNDFN